MDSTNFGDPIIGLLQGKSDVEYFKTLLDTFKNINGETSLSVLLKRLEVPNSVYNDPYEKKEAESFIKEEDKRIIWFITPFDGNTTITNDFLRSILTENFPWWDLKIANLEPSNWKFLWDSIENFLEQYPVYIADMRESNLNVALEIWYILWNKKQDAKFIFIVDESEKISDLQWMIRISKKKNTTPAWASPEDAAKRQDEINTKLKKELINQFNDYLK